MMAQLKRAWMPLLIVIVLGLGAFTVHRIRGFFAADGITTTPVVFADDPEPFDPKVVTYEVFGTPGAVVDINYVDLDAKAQEAFGVTLPWSITLETTKPAAAAHIVAQGNASNIGCRVIVDDELKDERVNSGVNAQVHCIVKSA